jgi:hypothetical protein
MDEGLAFFRRSSSGIAGFLVRVDVPDDVIWKSKDTVAGALGHFGKAFSLGLVFESVTREVDSCRAKTKS